MMICFSADKHLGHFNIIKYCNRPFTTEREMTDTIIRNHNEVVSDDDTIYEIGDVCLKSNQEMNFYQSKIRKMKGTKILILGNHDELKPFTYVNNVGFKSVHISLDIEVEGIHITMCHDPALSCIDRKRIFVCGHSHDLFRIQKNVINVSVENWDYKPVSFEQLKPYIEEIQKWQSTL